jgi:hypothetical protein
VVVPPRPSTDLQRAQAAWGPIEGLLRRPRFLPPSLRDGPWVNASITAVWGLSQVIAAGAQLLVLDALDPATMTTLLRVLHRYADGTGYDAFPGDRPRYYDDNAWIGLDFVQLHLATGDETHVADAARVLSFVRQGLRDDGGVHWIERPLDSIHTCSTAPVGELAARLHLLTGDEEAGAVAERTSGYLHARLRRGDALYRDNVRVDGGVDDAIYSYNQGTPVGLDVLRFRIDGDRTHLERAHETAAAALAHYGQGDRLWTEAPCFNAIFFRNLAALDAADPHPEVRVALDGYLERLWTEARDPATGWFTGGGIGSYERGGVLDQAGVVQLFAVAAWSQADAADLC